MLVATTMTVLGLLMGITAAQLGGLRLGGVVVVPLIAVYLLRSFGTFPVFVLSVIAAYVSVSVIKERIPIYGRPLFVVTILIGTLVPLTMFEVLGVGFGLREAITEVEFFGSILPGIAAYNLHRLPRDRRILDAVWSLTAVLFLVVVGIGLVILVGLTPLSGVLPPVLLSPESDIARAFGLTVSGPPLPVITPRRVSFGLVVLGTVLSEGIRLRYGLRVAGVIVVPLIVIMAFRNGWMPALWLGTTVLAYAGIRALHWSTLLYGRVLLSMAVVFGLLSAISLTTVVPVRHGVLAFFVGILGGVTAYNVHVVPPVERRATVAITAGAFVLVVAVARLLVVPSSNGALLHVTDLHVVVGFVLLLPGLRVVYRLERTLPSGTDADRRNANTRPLDRGGR